MKIAVVGPGAMGLLYGAKLSKYAEVILIGNNKEHIDEINENSITVKRDDKEQLYKVRAMVSGQEKDPVDMIILFTKAYITKEALKVNKYLIGEDTYILTLQNGAGHEEVLKEYTDEDHILIGTTTQGSYRENAHCIVNSGLGDTVIGSIVGVGNEKEALTSFLKQVRDVFEKSGFPCKISEDIRFSIWNKLMINASSSVLSGVLGTAQGYVAENEYAWNICCYLINEICEAANAEGCTFIFEEQKERIYNHLKAAPSGYTSIYSDIKNKRKTEVDYISGAVVRAAKKHGKYAYNQEMMVKIVHAMEQIQ